MYFTKRGVAAHLLIFLLVALVGIAVVAENTAITGKGIFDVFFGSGERDFSKLPDIEDVPLTPWSEYIPANPEQGIDEILEGHDERSIDMCQGALNRVLKACAARGFDGWFVKRMISGYDFVSGDITSHEDIIWGPRKCTQPQINKDKDTGEPITHYIISETENRMESAKDLSTGGMKSVQAACTFSCNGWKCPEESNPWTDPWTAGYCQWPNYTTPKSPAEVQKIIDELVLVQQIGCRQRGAKCDITKPCKVTKDEKDCQVRVSCYCNCPFIERPGQPIDDFVKDAPKDPFRNGTPQETDTIPGGGKPPTTLPPVTPQIKDACMTQPCRVMCDDRDGDGRIDISEAAKAYKRAGLDPRQAGDMEKVGGNRWQSPSSATGPDCEPQSIGRMPPITGEGPPPTPPPTPPTPPPTPPSPPPITGRPPETGTSRPGGDPVLPCPPGYSQANCEKQPDIMSMVQGYRCISGAHITKRQSKATGCGCSEPTFDVQIDSTPPKCSTPCGEVACDSSTTCSCGTRCIMTASCNWGGWKMGSGGTPVPVVGSQSQQQSQAPETGSSAPAAG